MSNLNIKPKWNPVINQVEMGEEISGGPSGNANIATRQLAENIFWLRDSMYEVMQKVDFELSPADKAAIIGDIEPKLNELRHEVSVLLEKAQADIDGVEERFNFIAGESLQETIDKVNAIKEELGDIDESVMTIIAERLANLDVAVQNWDDLDKEARTLLGDKFESYDPKTGVTTILTSLLDEERTTRSTENAAMSRDLKLMRSQVGGEWDAFSSWTFDSGLDSWSGGEWTEDGIVILKSTDNIISSPPLALEKVTVVENEETQESIENTEIIPLDGSRYNTVKMRIRRIGEPVWNGVLTYSTADGTEYTKDINIPVAYDPENGSNLEDVSGFNLVQVELAEEWYGLEIANMSVQLTDSTSDTDYFEIDWITVGRQAPTISAADILTLQNTFASKDKAYANELRSLSAQLTLPDGVGEGVSNFKELVEVLVDESGAYGRHLEELKSEYKWGDGVTSLATAIKEFETTTIPGLAAASASEVINASFPGEDGVEGYLARQAQWQSHVDTSVSLDEGSRLSKVERGVADWNGNKAEILSGIEASANDMEAKIAVFEDISAKFAGTSESGLKTLVEANATATQANATNFESLHASVMGDPKVPGSTGLSGKIAEHDQILLDSETGDGLVSKFNNLNLKVEGDGTLDNPGIEGNISSLQSIVSKEITEGGLRETVIDDVKQLSLEDIDSGAAASITEFNKIANLEGDSLLVSGFNEYKGQTDAALGVIGDIDTIDINGNKTIAGALAYIASANSTTIASISEIRETYGDLITSNAVNNRVLESRYQLSQEVIDTAGFMQTPEYYRHKYVATLNEEKSRIQGKDIWDEPKLAMELKFNTDLEPTIFGLDKVVYVETKVSYATVLVYDASTEEQWPNLEENIYEYKQDLTKGVLQTVYGYNGTVYQRSSEWNDFNGDLVEEWNDSWTEITETVSADKKAQVKAIIGDNGTKAIGRIEVTERTLSTINGVSNEITTRLDASLGENNSTFEEIKKNHATKDYVAGEFGAFVENNFVAADGTLSGSIASQLQSAWSNDFSSTAEAVSNLTAEYGDAESTIQERATAFSDKHKSTVDIVDEINTTFAKNSVSAAKNLETFADYAQASATQLSNLTANFGGESGDMSAVVAKLSNISKVVANAQGAYASVDERLNASFSGVTETIERIEQQVTGISIGGRNLVPNSKESITSNKHLVKAYTLTEDFVKDEEYTVTVHATITKPTTKLIAYQNGPTTSIGDFDEVAPGIFRKTFNAATPIAGRRNVFSVYQMPSTGGGTTVISSIKLEKGNKATDWSPAPEDITKSINAVSSAFGDFERDYTAALADGIISNAEGRTLLVSAEKIRSDGQALYTQYEAIKNNPEANATFKGELLTAAQNVRNQSVTIADTIENIVSAKQITDEQSNVISNAFKTYDLLVAEYHKKYERVLDSINKTYTNVQVGTAVKTVEVEYYVSTKSTAPAGGEWAVGTPSWSNTSFIFSRTKTTLHDGTERYTDPVNITGAKGATGPIGPPGVPGNPGLDGLDGKDGTDGLPGKDGESSYTHIAYATTASGGGFKHAHFAAATYIGIVVNKNPDSSKTVAGDYKWSLIKGAKGDKGDHGVPGNPGANGLTPYLHIAYADSADGTVGFVNNEDEVDVSNKLYIGQYTSYSLNGESIKDSANPKDYTWTLIKGAKGDKGAAGSTGAKGDTGVGVERLIPQWALTGSKTVPPAETSREWVNAMPAWDGEGNYWYWMRTLIEYTDGTSVPTTPVIDTSLESFNSRLLANSASIDTVKEVILTDAESTAKETKSINGVWAESVKQYYYGMPASWQSNEWAQLSTANVTVNDFGISTKSRFYVTGPQINIPTKATGESDKIFRVSVKLNTSGNALHYMGVRHSVSPTGNSYAISNKNINTSGFEDILLYVSRDRELLNGLTNTVTIPAAATWFKPLLLLNNSVPSGSTLQNFEIKYIKVEEITGVNASKFTETVYTSSTEAASTARSLSELVTNFGGTAATPAQTGAAIKALKSAVSDANGSYINVSQSLSTTYSNATEEAKRLADAARDEANEYADTQVSNIEVGGRNLLRGDPSGDDFWHSKSNVTIWGDVIIVNDETLLPKIKPINVKPGETYAISYSVATDTIGTFKLMRIEFWDNANKVIGNIWPDDVMGTADAGDYKRFSHVIKVPDNPSISSISLGPRFYKSGSTSATFAFIQQIKVEKGNIATDWSPAPEDILAAIPTVNDFTNSAAFKTKVETLVSEKNYAESAEVTTLQSQLYDSVSKWSYDFKDDKASWKNHLGSGEYAFEDNWGKFGNNAGNDQLFLISDKYTIPVKKGLVYKIVTEVRIVSGAGKTFIGFGGLAANGTAWVNTTGANSATSAQHYVTSVEGTSTTFSEIIGYASTDADSLKGLTNTVTLHPNVKFIRPLVLVNDSYRAGQVIVKYVNVEAMDNVQAAYIQQSFKTVDGLTNKYALEANSNGYVTGMYVTNSDGGVTSKTSDITFIADNFNVATSASGGKLRPFRISGNKIYAKDLVVDTANVTGILTIGHIPNNEITLDKLVPAERDKINNAANDIANLEIGGRNLIVLSAKGIVEGKYLSASGAATTSTAWFITDSIPVTPNGKYILSGYTNLGSAPSTVFYDAAGAYISGVAGAKRQTVTAPANAASMKISLVKVDKPTVKLEKGNKASDWTPAPEDVDAAIEAADKKASQAEGWTQLIFGAVVDMTADNKITPSEKRELSRIKDEIVSTHTELLNSVKTVPGATTPTTYTTSYSNVTTRLTNAAASPTTTSDITSADRTDLTKALSKYFTERAKLNDTLITKTKEYAESQANAARDAAIKDAETKDTRSVNSLPSWYQTNHARKIVREFKTKSVIGLTGGTGTYCYLETQVKYSDASGGRINQTAYTDDSKVFTRNGSGSTWTAWVESETTAGAIIKAAEALKDAKTYADTKTSGAVTEITSDNKITPNEKRELLRVKDEIVSTHTELLNSVKTVPGAAVPTTYTTAYSNVTTRLTNAAASPTTITNITTTDRTNLTKALSTYFTERAKLNDLIVTKSKAYIESQAAIAKTHADNIAKVEVIDAKTKRFISPAVYNSNASAVSGYLIIETPIASARMVKLNITGYNYQADKSNIDLSIGFYFNGAFHNFDYADMGTYPIGNVRLGIKNSKVVIVIGNSNSSWSYPKINVTQAIIGYTDPPDTYKTGWVIRYSTSIADITGVRLMDNIKSVSIKSLQDNVYVPGTVQVNGANIKAGTVTATQINAAGLKVAAANVTGTITAGAVKANMAISAPTITGGSIKIGSITGSAENSGNTADASRGTMFKVDTGGGFRLISRDNTGGIELSSYSRALTVWAGNSIRVKAGKL